jgi:diguanylate cyclase (GGDEF)-like protein
MAKPTGLLLFHRAQRRNGGGFFCFAAPHWQDAGGWRVVLLSIVKRPTVTRAILVVVAYWSALLFLSVYRFESQHIDLLLMPLLVIGGLPIIGLSGYVMWKAANVRVTNLAFVDDLTGLHNRRAFTYRAMELVKKSTPGAASLVLIDVDGLKKVNDDCGHLAGDELLEEVAHHLGAMSNTVYRLGGDEFAILIDRGDGESVTALMRSLTPLTHRFRTCGHEHVIQFSYGFASRRDQETFEQVFSRADARLRQFKYRLYASGRREERRMARGAAEAEMARLLAEAEEDEKHDESTVVSIFSHARRHRDDAGPRSATGE